MSSRIERPALGQKVPLGTLYNAHTDTFQNMSLFFGSLPPETVHTSQINEASTAINDIDSHNGRCALMDIGSELAASLFSDLAPRGGSGNCLTDRADSMRDRSAEDYYGAFHHRLVTVRHQLQPNHPALREQVSTDSLGYREFTHVVTEIAWGCQTVIVARGTGEEDGGDATTDNDDGVPASGQESFSHAMVTFKNAVDELRYAPDLDLQGTGLKGMKLSVTAYSEIVEEESLALQDLGEAFAFIKLLPSLLQHNDMNGGRGEFISYTLLPIQTVASLLGLPARGSYNGGRNSSFAFSQEFLGRLVDQFDEVESIWFQMRAHGRILAMFKAYVPPSHAKDVDDAVEMVSEEWMKLRRSFAHMLTSGRMRGPDTAAVMDLSQSLKWLQSRGEHLLDVAAVHREKIAFANMAVRKGAVYVGHNGISLASLLSHCAHEPGRETFVLSYSHEAMAADETSWEGNRTLLFDLLARKTEQASDAVVVVMDTDALPQPQDRAQITHRNKQGEVVTHDLHEQRQFETGHSFARWNDGALASGPDIQKPVQRRMVKVPCPGAGCDNLQACSWFCSRCSGAIEFGYTDDYFYCDCGRAAFSAWTFKCNSPDHGTKEKGKKAGQAATKRTNKKNEQNEQKTHHGAEYVAYKNKKQLLSILKSLEQTDYVNILILGETGVGKSTFINALVNYLSFPTLAEAQQAEELSWVVPCAFSIQTMDRSRPTGAIQEHKVQVGVRDDEKDGSAGASATQQTAVYPVNVGSKTVRLIDTPGIGDTRGLAFDKKNMADILRTLSSYEQLHGILILLKSNNARLTVTFNFCMQELLTHLHSSAARNMAFGFTNTRVSNYSPGDTFGPLSTLLARHTDIGLALANQNTFCFDSESFRYLAAFQDGLAMENEADFRRSWDHSRAEAERLVAFFESKTPHQVRSTLSLNGTRQLIAELTKPMADITSLITANIKVCGDQMQELHDTELSGDKLRQRLQVPKIHLRTRKLDRPLTVCRNERCVEWRDDGSGSVVRMYKNPCHSPCHLTNVEVDRVNCPELMRCTAFRGDGNFCRRPACGHSWQEHLHIYYELEEYTALVTDTEAQRLFRQNESDIKVKQAAVTGLECRAAEYREEHAKIKEAAARFGLFLKKHSITPYNDATLEYLDMLIREEEQKSRVSRDTAKLEGLREDRQSHMELVQVLEASMADSSSSGGGEQLDEAGVEAAVQDLYRLQHFGKMLQDVKNGVAEAHQATYRERPFKVHPARSSRSATSHTRPPRPPPSSSSSSHYGHGYPDTGPGSYHHSSPSYHSHGSPGQDPGHSLRNDYCGEYSNGSRTRQGSSRLYSDAVRGWGRIYVSVKDKLF